MMMRLGRMMCAWQCRRWRWTDACQERNMHCCRPNRNVLLVESMLYYRFHVTILAVHTACAHDAL